MIRINTTMWKEFQIGNIFTLKRPTARSQAHYEEGTVPFVASGNYNNGVVKWCKPKKEEKLDPQGCISVSPLDGCAFFQPNDFLGRGGAGSAILLLLDKQLTENSGLFIATVLRTALSKFSYNNQINSQTILLQTIKLPVSNDGEPDWVYMETYMDKILRKTSTTIEQLKKII